MLSTVEPLASAPSDVVQEADTTVAATENAASDTPDNATDQKPDAGDDAVSTESPEDRIKKLAKALERDKRKIGKLHAQTAQERERADRLEQAINELNKRFEPQQPQTPVDTDPKYNSYAEFLDDKTKHTAGQIVEQKIAAFQKSQQEQQQQSQWVQQRSNNLDSRIDTLIKGDLPDYEAVLTPHADTIKALSPQVKAALLGTDGSELAVYQLAQEDALDDLLGISMDEAKGILEQAAQRADIAIKAKKTTKAPTPMAPTKGTATGNKSLDRMTAQELMMWAKGR